MAREGMPLLDLYELTMAEAYLREGVDRAPATFSLFARDLPAGWGYLVAAGLDAALDAVEGLAFHGDALAWLESLRLFTPALLRRLESARFTGSVRAVPEGLPVQPDEPLVEVTGPLLEAQLVEGAVMNPVHLESLIATRAARCVHVAGGRPLIDFALRRAHGADAAMAVARATRLGGFASTSNVPAGRRSGIPVAGTMAHSFVQAFPDELTAFRAYVRTHPDRPVLLVDTYDSVTGVRRAATVGVELARAGRRLGGVRLDSGDLDALAREARRVLDAAGLRDATVVASGGLDEWEIDRLVQGGAPIDAFGVGSRVGASAGASFLDMAYKLVEVGDRPVLKLSPRKATLPGRKQVWRTSGGAVPDVLALADEPGPAGGAPLLTEVMRDGARLHREDLEVARL
ncbi:MAG: nicotinate phosphoribosyltransferase, partial [Actinomycetota bacterium]